MAAQVGPQATQAWDRMGRWLTRSYTVDADVSGARRAARARSRTQSLVFLPNHRSYLDPLVLAVDPGAARLPAQPHPGRHQPRDVADLGARPAQRADLHPAYDEGRPCLSRDDAALLRAACCASTPISSGTSRAAAPAPASCGPRRWACCATSSTRSLRNGDRRGRRCARAGGHRLRPAGRGGGAVATRSPAGPRRPESLGCPGAVRPRPVAWPRPGPPALRAARVAAASRSARPRSAPARPIRARSYRGSPSRSPTGSTPPRRSRRRRW